MVKDNFELEKVFSSIHRTMKYIKTSIENAAIVRNTSSTSQITNNATGSLENIACYAYPGSWEKAW